LICIYNLYEYLTQAKKKQQKTDMKYLFDSELEQYLSSSDAEFGLICNGNNIFVYVGKLTRFVITGGTVTSFCWHDGPTYEYSYSISFENTKDPEIINELFHLQDASKFAFYKL